MPHNKVLQQNLSLTKIININPKILVVNYIKQNNYFSKIIGYNNINKYFILNNDIH